MEMTRDDMEWSQIKSNVQYKLHCLKNFDWIDDFTEDIEEISKALDRETNEREIDD